MSFKSTEDMSFYLQQRGWKREVAGQDFDRVISMFCKVMSMDGFGLMIGGDYGCGKTMFVNCCGVPFEKTHKFDLNDSRCTQFLDPEGKYFEFVMDTMKGNVLLDDLGAEHQINQFGIKREVIGDYICAYHRNGKGRLFITTNKNKEELMDRYGGRVWDRLKELVLPVRMTGSSHRKWGVR